MQAAIEEHFTPEFLNRVDRIIYFEPLDEALLLAIFDKLLDQVTERFKAQNIEVEVSEALKRDLCQRHTDTERGARPLERAIEDEIVAWLTDKLLAGEVKPGMKVVVEVDERIRLEQAPPAEGAGQAGPPSPAGLDERDARKAQNEDVFEREAPALVARLGERGLEIEIHQQAKEFICDPFWTELPVAQALLDLIEKPLLRQMEEGKFEAGDRVRVEKYADHLEFKKMAGE